MAVRKSVECNVAGLSISVVSALSYLVDWATYIAMLVFAIIWGSQTVPHKVDFSVWDITIMHQYVPENETYAPIWYLIILIAIIPIIMIVICCYWYLQNRSKSRMLWDIHQSILGSFGAISSQLILVVVVKNITGIPRPDFLQRCQPNYNDVTDFQLATDAICSTADEPLINEGFRSFPSGHSSTVFASQVFLSLFLIGKIKIDAVNFFSWKLLVSIVYPLIVALKISFSRVSDNRHRIQDVLFGNLIGLIFGTAFYFLYFTNPFTKKISVAICPRKFEIVDTFVEFLNIRLSCYDLDNEVDQTKYTEHIDEDAHIFPQQQNLFSPRFDSKNFKTRPHTVNSMGRI
ncbi:hypothetical protein CANINC_000354 [Pichia inconspicua]|uniref:Phosphatidic acid phosphatase type 2/haloperoxidase domain-containing protein n=1 Tax=Pichia inconspicua TaxID=52247 RepID=A0A4V4NG94_9ASCO|nr:hypothetical protein CANINC_000354 [[Candida] inconspicua]